MAEYRTSGVAFGQLQYSMSDTKIEKGNMVMIASDGYAYTAAAAASNHGVVGIAIETVDNSAGSDGDLDILVEHGIFEIAGTTLGQDDVGSIIYASNGYTIDETDGGNYPECGVLVEYISASLGRAWIGQAKNSSTLTGMNATNVANVADDNVLGGIPLIHRIAIASGANANYDVAVTNKSRVIDAWVVMNGAGTAGCTFAVQNVTDPITDSVDLSSAGDTDVLRAGEIDNDYHEIAAGANLRGVIASSGGDFPGAELYVMTIQVA